MEIKINKKSPEGDLLPWLDAGDIDSPGTLFRILDFKSHHVANSQVGKLYADQASGVEEDVFVATFGSDKTEVFIGYQALDGTFHST